MSPARFASMLDPIELEEFQEAARTLLAPPRRSSRRSARNRITGASWLMRSASPQT